LITAALDRLLNYVISAAARQQPTERLDDHLSEPLLMKCAG
jgi:hypothetical protein